MLEITKEVNGDEMVVVLKGRLDTNTSKDMSSEVVAKLDDIKTLILDFKELSYISSAGLRVLLDATQTLSERGEMRLRNVSRDTMDVFDVTGFSNILKFE